MMPSGKTPEELTRLRDLTQAQWRRSGSETPLDGLLLNSTGQAGSTIRTLYRPSFCVVLQGAKVSTVGAQELRYRAGQSLLTTINVPANSRIVVASQEHPYVAFSLTIDPETVSALLLEHAVVEKTPASPASNLPALQTAPLCPRLLDPLERLLRLLDAPADLPVLAPMIRREITWHLLGSELGAALRQIGMKDTETARIGRVSAWIRSHYAESLRVADLAAMAHMSLASFHRHFKNITGLTPIQFQKQVRLLEARRLLLTESEVASAGYRVGYESASQFSRDYRRLFGVPPGRDKSVIRSGLMQEGVV